MPTCTNQAAWVQDVATPPNTAITAGQTFSRIWRVRNTGTCVWGTDYALAYDSGNQMGGLSPQPLAGGVQPGQTIDIKLDLKAPAASGSYAGYWLFQAPTDERFGLSPAADPRLSVSIVVGPAGPTAVGGWKGEYFNNRDLKGSPKLTRTDATIAFKWGTNAPGAGLPSDDFSVRWTGKSTFDSGAYRFKLTVDDGARLYVDGTRVLDAWETGSARQLSVDVGLAKGTHTIVLEYFEHKHDAQVSLTWEKASAVTISHWKGEYWSNENLSGTPSLVRDDREIDFRWESKSPVGLPADRFSARWTRTIDFKSGDYTFRVKVDDGVRIRIDGKVVLNAWDTVDETTLYTFTRHLSGKHKVIIEYFEHTRQARAYVAWELQPTPSPTVTPTPSATNSPEPTETELPTPTETDTPAP